MIDQDIGHYRVLDKIGEGGMGVVYKAHDTRLDRTVALKLLPPEMTTDNDRRERFSREARAVAAISHPNIVTIFAVEEHDGAPFLAMEYVEGQSLEKLISPDGLPLSRFFGIGIPIAEALTAAHERHVTHRDLKPANILIGSSGEVKVLDFGLARFDRSKDGAGVDGPTATLTQAGHVLGTVPYMSPEQVQGLTPDHRSDIFSLGIILFEMATGERPFLGDSPADLISSILRDVPRSVTDFRPDLPRHLGRIVRHCIEKDPKRRYQTALDVANELRDLKREVDSGELSGPHAATPRISPEAEHKSHRSPLVAREDERSELRRALEEAQGGRGSLIMIGGEPGVGKTRLIDELVPEARERGFLTLVGHSYDSEGARPFSPWVEILEYSSRVAHREVLREILGDAAPEVAKILPELRRIYPDIPQPVALPPEQERHFLFTSFREYLDRSSRVQPLLLALEDLQWADESTLQLLQHVAPSLSSMAILTIGTYRDVELDASRPLGRALRQLVRERLATRIGLKRLDRSGVALLLEGLSDQEPPYALVEVLFDTTEGNPFFVEEVFQHLEEQGELFDGEGRWRRDLRMEEIEVPEGVRLVVGRRLEGLDEEARKVLTAAAVIGRRFHFDLLEAVADGDADSVIDAIEEAERLHLIKTVSGREIRFDFTQELVRQTLASGLSALRRQRLHLRIAEAMERVFAGDLENRASSLAYHLYEAGAAADPKKAVRYLGLAGRQAMGAAAGDEALGFFEDALSLLEPEDRRERADLLFRQGWTLRSLGRWEEAEKSWLEALPIYEELGDAGEAVRVCLAAAGQILWSSRFAEGARVAQRGLEFLGDAPSMGRARLLASAAAGLAQAGDLAAAEPLMTDAIAFAESRQDLRALGELLISKAFMHYPFMQYKQCIEAGLRGGELLAKDAEHGAVSNLSAAQMAMLRAGRLAEAAKLGERLEPLAVRLGHSGAQRLLTEVRASGAVMSRGEFATFRELADAMREHMVAVGQPVSASHVMEGLVHFWQGRWKESLTSLGEGLRLDDYFKGTFYEGDSWGYLLLCRAYAGDRDTALGMLDAPDAPLPASGEPIQAGRCSALFGAVEGLAVLGERQRAGAFYPLVLECLETDIRVRRFGYGLAATVGGIAAAAAEQWDAAESHFETSLRLAQDLPHVVEQSEARCWYAGMLLDRDGDGDRERARRLLEHAIEGYRRLGMPKHLETAETLRARAAQA